VQQLAAAAAPIHQASGLDRSQELYTWANILIQIWPDDVLAAPAAAAVVTAAAEVAAYHLQSMTDMQRANALLTAQHRRPLPLPRLGGVAAAAELGKCLGQELVTYLPDTQQQQQELQAGREVDLPAEVERMLQQSYQQLLPLCATAIAFDGVHLAWLMERKQQQDEQIQKLLDSSTAAATSGAAAEADTAAAAAGTDSASQTVAAGSAASPAAGLPVEAAAPAEPGSSSVAGQETTAAAAAAAAATSSLPQPSAAAAATAGACSSSSRASRRSPADFPAAVAAAAAAAESSLLQSAGLLSQLPDWVSAIPAWGDLLKGSWADMGYTVDLHEEVHREYDDSSDASSSSTSHSAHSNSSSDSSNGSGSGSSGSSSGSSSASDDISSYLRSKGITRDTAYQLCVDACCTKWLDNCQVRGASCWHRAVSTVPVRTVSPAYCCWRLQLGSGEPELLLSVLD
jgi:hypothetical protein